MCTYYYATASGNQVVFYDPLQVKLLNSISENLGEAMKSAQSRAEFSHQFESIVKGVEVCTCTFKSIYLF